MNLVKRVIGFGIAPILSIILPTVVLPVVARASTGDQWAALGIGQASGTIVATIVSFGWTLHGVVAVGSATQAGRRRLWTEFTIGSTLLLVIGCLIAAPIVGHTVAHGTTTYAIAILIATGCGGLTPAWYAIGTGRPRAMVTYATIPRIAGTVLGAIIILPTREVMWYPIGMCAGTVFGMAAFSARVSPLIIDRGVHPFLRMREQLPAASATLFDSLYSGGFIQIAALFLSSGALVPLNSADRLFRLAKQAVNAFTGALQEWVGHDQGRVRSRQRLSIFLHLGVGCVGSVVLATIGPWMTAILFGRSFAANRTLSVIYGVALIATSCGSPIAKHVLAIQHRDASVFWSTVLGVAVLAVTVWPLTSSLGAPGAAIAYCLVEVAVTIARLAVMRRPRRMDRTRQRTRNGSASSPVRPETR
jgi:O-antigen/teichoic acid export membrane protein